MLPSWIDWSFVAVFAGAWPAFENLVRLPRVKVEIAAHGSRRRISEYRFTMLQEWLLVAIALALIAFDRRPWASAGLVLPHGAGIWWTLGIVLAVAVLLRMQYRVATGTERARASVNRQLTAVRWFLPSSTPELANFRALSVTAGVCEEILFRGYLMAFLLPFGGVGVAVAVSSLLFALGHGYQGVVGIVKSGVIGALMAGMYVLTGSLLAPILVHALIDLMSGQIAADVPVDS
jgi:membrane protease YdiL (CAAX protease family)